MRGDERVVEGEKMDYERRVGENRRRMLGNKGRKEKGG